MKSRATISVILTTTLLQGCGVDALRIAGASGVASTSATVVTQVNAVLDQAKARREQAYDTFIASDPSCPVTGDVYLFVPTSAPAAPPAAGGKGKKPVEPPSVPLCANGPGDSFAGYRVVKMNAPLIGPIALKPTVALVGALADYEAALAKATSKTNPDLTKEMQGIADKANDALSVAKALTGSKLAGVPDLASKQVTAATDILDFVATLVQQHEEVRDVGKIVVAQHQKFADLVPQLLEQVDEWQQVTSLGYAEVLEANLRQVYDREKDRADFSTRLQLVTSIRQAEVDRASIPQTSTAIKQAIGKFSEADTLLTNRLAGKLSPEDRKKATDDSVKEIFDGLHLIASAVAAWGLV